MSQDPTVTTPSSQDHHGLMETVSNPNAGNNLPSSAILVSSASLVNALAKARLPTNYIGVRRVRPSHRGLATPKTSADAAAATSTTTTATTTTTTTTTTRTTTSKVVFKVTNSDGSERRMNRQEKKALKQQLALERKTQAVERKNSQKRKAEELAETVRSDPSDSSSNIVLGRTSSDASPNTACNYYHQLSVDTAAMEQELAELRGERSGLPPVVLSPPLAWLARPHLEGIAAGTLPIVARIQYDAALSQEWATSIQQSMRPAEIVRDNEPNLRPMAYQLTPEPWTRLRVAASEEPLATSLSSHLPLDDSPSNPNLAATDDKNGRGRGRGHAHDHPKKDWTSMVCRPPSRLDWISTVVLEYLHRTQSNVHVSCGAKFGADLLVYDGPRDERHAFAGLRLLVPETRPATANNDQAASASVSVSASLPLVSTDTLSGYVRCLNTAGKLALLATVVVDQPNKVYRVALVDVALEKILTAPTHQRHARTNKRRDVSQNLAKHH